MSLKRGFLFDWIEGNNLRRSTFDLSYENKLTASFGDLVPFFSREVVPGDVFRISNSFFTRTAPLVFPVMHRIDIRFHYFFVPYRILWHNWEKFRAHGNGTVAMSKQSTWTPPEIPKIDYRSISNDRGTLADYLGVPSKSDDYPYGALFVNALKFIAYQRIWDDWYRNEALQERVSFSDPDEDVISCKFNGQLHGNIQVQLDYMRNILSLRKCNYEKDYFTSALPSPQLGADTSLPLSNTNIAVSGYYTDGNEMDIQDRFEGKLYQTPLGVGGQVMNPEDPTGETKLAYLRTKLSEATAVNISDLRRAFSLQRYKELIARSGTRYKEWLRGVFGMQTKDARLDRAEYIGGYTSPLQIGEVLQTSQSSSDSPLGTYAGRATAQGAAKAQTYSVREDGVIMGLLSILPRTGYYQGINRELTRMSPYDFFIPNFENIGEQEIYNYELYANNRAEPHGVFGYIPRYAEYKYSNDEVHGEFKDKSFLSWHAARSFDAIPNLNEAFVQVGDYSRLFAVKDEPQFFIDLYNIIKASRPMSKYGNPW